MVEDFIVGATACVIYTKLKANRVYFVTTLCINRNENFFSQTKIFAQNVTLNSKPCCDM